MDVGDGADGTLHFMVAHTTSHNMYTMRPITKH